jgi:ubiquinone/menaquinone biosynthesis C-methylase UbiE
MNRDRFETVAAQWNFNPQIVQMFRAFVELYRQEIPLSTEMDVLDVGGGTGLIAFDIAESVKSVTIVDNSPAMVKTAREHLKQQNINNVEIIENDIIHADLKAASFDRIYTHMALHHIENIDEAFGAFGKLIKSGGSLVIGDLCTEDGSFHGDEPVPHNGFDTDELSNKLKAIGFSSTKVVTLESMDRPSGSFERFFLVAVK